jgi:hypothetical protein
VLAPKVIEEARKGADDCCYQFAANSQLLIRHALGQWYLSLRSNQMLSLWIKKLNSSLTPYPSAISESCFIVELAAWFMRLMALMSFGFIQE